MVVAPAAAAATNNHQSAADIKPQHEISPPNAPTTKTKSNNNNYDDDPAKPKYPFGCHPAKRGVIIVVVYEIIVLLIYICELIDSIETDKMALIIRYGAVGILAFMGLIFLIIALITEKQQFFIPYFCYRVLAILGVIAFTIYSIYDISSTSHEDIQNIHKYYNTSIYKPVNIFNAIVTSLLDILRGVFRIHTAYKCYIYFRDLKTPQQLPDPIAIKTE